MLATPTPKPVPNSREVSASPRLRVVVLTSGRLGMTVAAGLRDLAAVADLTIVTAPLSTRRTPLAKKLRGMYHEGGWPRLLAAAAARLRQPVRDPESEMRRLAAEFAPGVTHVHVPGFHTPDCLALLGRLAPDLGVVIATHILRREVFSAPRLGCINLHLGKAPEFRGSSPGFWEMYHGVAEVGVTVHWVTDTLDGGDILMQETFPLDIAPPSEPLRYLLDYQWTVLLPHGCRMLGEVVSRIAAGECTGIPQDNSRARTFRRATYQAKRELRRRVVYRRRRGA